MCPGRDEHRGCAGWYEHSRRLLSTRRRQGDPSEVVRACGMPLENSEASPWMKNRWHRPMWRHPHRRRVRVTRCAHSLCEGTPHCFDGDSVGITSSPPPPLKVLS